VKLEDVKKVGVLGGGVMGGGIAQVVSLAGYPVIVRDINEEVYRRHARLAG
jgi:3-hydroxyacyl-CoA dehydrogenase